eukprot:6196332-Pleurochrysis_carterae.AAC.1
MMYDWFCGAGTMGRGAILGGSELVGFDIARRPSTYGFNAVSHWGVRDMKCESLQESSEM